MTAEEALREALLDLPEELLSTETEREALAEDYERQAETAHPAVAPVLRVAAERVRAMLANE